MNGVDHVEVVVEAVGDGRADAELRGRVDLLHRLGEHVRGRVPQDGEAVRGVDRHGLDHLAVGHRQVQVAQLAVDADDDDLATLGEQVRRGGPRPDRDLDAVDGEGEGLGGRCRHGGGLLALVVRPVRTLATMLPTPRAAQVEPPAVREITCGCPPPFREEPRLTRGSKSVTIEAMDADRTESLRRRAALHRALADPARLQIVDSLALGDASPSELAEALGMPSNLLAHHLKVLEREGVVGRGRSEGDRRRSYVHLVPGTLDRLGSPPARPAARVLFVCTANSARSHLAAALWRRASAIPAESAGTHPAAAISPGVLDSARRHGLDVPEVRPQHVADARGDDDLVVTVCDRAHEELVIPVDVHWSIPDPLRLGTPEAFDGALEEIARRVDHLAPHLVPTS